MLRKDEQKKPNKSMDYMKSIWNSIKEKSVSGDSNGKNKPKFELGDKLLKFSNTFDISKKKKQKKKIPLMSKMNGQFKFNMDNNFKAKSNVQEDSGSTFKFSFEEFGNPSLNIENSNYSNFKNSAKPSSDHFSYPYEVKTVKNCSKKNFEEKNFLRKSLSSSKNGGNGLVRVKNYLQGESSHKRKKEIFEMKKKFEENSKNLEKLQKSKECIKSLQNKLALREMELSELRTELRNYKRMLNSVKSIEGGTLGINIENERLRKDLKALIECFAKISKIGINNKNKFSIENSFEALKESFESKGDMTYVEIEGASNLSCVSKGKNTRRKKSKKRMKRRKTSRSRSRCYSCSSEAETYKNSKIEEKNIEEYLDDFLSCWVPKEVGDVLEKVQVMAKVKESKFRVIKVRFNF